MVASSRVSEHARSEHLRTGADKKRAAEGFRGELKMMASEAERRGSGKGDGSGMAGKKGGVRKRTHLTTLNKNLTTLDKNLTKT